MENNNTYSSKIREEALTFEDVLLVPRFSETLPRQVDISSFITTDLKLNAPIVSAAMDTVTEYKLAIAIARQGGIGFVHSRTLAIEYSLSPINV